MLELPEIAGVFKECALIAGEKILDIYSGCTEVETKADGSPVTLADKIAHKTIFDILSKSLADIPLVSEEDPSSHAFGRCERFISVDPLDGTKEFICHRGEFTVNIALVVKGEPILGVVYAPVQDRLFWTPEPGVAFEKIDSVEHQIKVRTPKENALRAVVSHSHLDPRTAAYLEEHEINDCTKTGSSLKFCLIAAGEADIYPRFSPTMEWDTAAGHAVLVAAGGRVIQHDGQPLRYCKNDLLNKDGFIAYGGAR